MPYENVVLSLIALLGVLGAVGGIPQMLRWVKIKPHLRIKNATISKLPNENYKFQLQFEVENERKTLTRNGDASNVTFDYYVVDKDSFQRGATFDQAISPYLLAGLKTVKETEAYLALTPEGNPYSIIFRVTCKEGNSTVEKIAFKTPPIEYA
jgi:hypothetical protein